MRSGEDAGLLLGRLARDEVLLGRTVAIRLDLGTLATASWYARVRGIDAAGLEGFDAVKLIAIREPVRWRITSSTLSLREGRNQLDWAVQRDNGQPLPVQRFTVELATDAAFANVLLRQEPATPSLQLGELKPGAFFLRLRPVLADGKTLDAAVFRMDLSANWGVTVFDNGFPLVPVAGQ